MQCGFKDKVPEKEVRGCSGEHGQQQKHGGTRLNTQCVLDRAGVIPRGLPLTDSWMNFTPGHQLPFKFHLLLFRTYWMPLKADADARRGGQEKGLKVFQLSGLANTATI